MKTPIYYFRSTGAVAAAPAFDPAASVKIKQIKFTLSSAGGESVTGIVTARAGTAYNVTLLNESMNGIASLLKTDVNFIMPAGDVLNFAYTNAATATWGLEVAYERIEP